MLFIAAAGHILKISDRGLPCLSSRGTAVCGISPGAELFYKPQVSGCKTRVLKLCTLQFGDTFLILILAAKGDRDESLKKT